MSGRNSIARIDLSAWKDFDASALPSHRRQTLTARRQAVELYAAQVAVVAIEKQTGVNRRQLYRLLARCQAVSVQSDHLERLPGA